MRSTGNCSVVSQPVWTTFEYADRNGVVVEEWLHFNGSTRTFEQTVVAATLQPSGCTANAIVWTGDYEQDPSAHLQFRCTRCTLVDPGCLACAPTRIEEAAVAYNDDCTAMTLTPTGDLPRTYYSPAAKASRGVRRGRAHGYREQAPPASDDVECPIVAVSALMQ